MPQVDAVVIPAGLRLVEPSLDRLEGYLAMIETAQALGEDGDGYNLPITGIIRRDRPTYVRRLGEIEVGVDLPPSWVPMSTRWLVDAAGTLLGEARLRHRLSPPLEIEGGHVGYFIHPHHRGRGYGHAILALALGELRRLGVEAVLVTCNADNPRSRRVIERNGGVFDRYTTSPKSGKKVMRFWISE